MATILAHIEIKPGTEAQWEAIMSDMVSHTFAHEDGVLRYEYFKGQSPLHYYCLLSFEDKWAFYVHQASEYHEEHDFESVLAKIELEYLDPVKGACDLPPTLNPPLPADATNAQRATEAIFPISVPGWWSGRA
jgi:quinol monooxygenase YgiN